MSRQQHDDVTQAALAQELGADRVMSFAAWCALADVSLSTGKRIVAAGNGPRLTQTSVRRKGVRISDHHAWLDACAIANSSDTENETARREPSGSNFRKGTPSAAADRA